MKDLKVIFMGTPKFSVPVLEKLLENTQVVLVVTQPDKPVGRKHMLTSSPVKKIAMENNIPVFQPEKIRKDFERVLQTPCDILITCAYGQIIPKEILEYPRLGCINVHASLLPKYRGGAPIHWCLINGEEKTGVSIMYMAEKMDAGDIIAQEEYLILPEDNVGTLHEKLSHIGADLLIKTLPSIIAGTNNRIVQDESKVTFGYNIKREEEHVDFNDLGKNILNKIRGLNPWPMANILVNDEEYKILEADFSKKENTVPYKINEITKDAIGIECQDGIIYIKVIKPFGKKIMNVKDFLNGTKKEEIEKWQIS